MFVIISEEGGKSLLNEKDLREHGGVIEIRKEPWLLSFLPLARSAPPVLLHITDPGITYDPATIITALGNLGHQPDHPYFTNLRTESNIDTFAPTEGRFTGCYGLILSATPNWADGKPVFGPFLAFVALGRTLECKLSEDVPGDNGKKDDDGFWASVDAALCGTLKSDNGVKNLHESESNQSVDFLISVRHDCIMAGCPIDARKAEMQEREMTSRKSPAVRHVDDDHSILNTHSMHNSNRLRQLLPPSLITPNVLYPYRQAKHRERGEKATLPYIEKQSRRKKGSKTARPAAEEDSKGLEVVDDSACTQHIIRERFVGSTGLDEFEGDDEDGNWEPEDAESGDEGTMERVNEEVLLAIARGEAAGNVY
ncbi:hypothetical protein C356_03559, partial [Cryptococcus neoformans c45]